MKYIDNKEENGLVYDFRKIEREYNKLKIPSKYFRPQFSQLPKHKYFVGLSERRTGKTTNWLLLGMVMNKLYDTRIIYVRQTSDMIAPKFSMEIFKIILDWKNGEYIRLLTNGKYNSIIYDTRKYYYACIDSNGVVERRHFEPFMHAVSIDEGINMKSTFNVPKGDMILFDEFVSPRYRDNEAIKFFDLCSTIIRGRLSPFIVMLANTINLNNEYFYELEIANTIKDMGYGDKMSITTDKGTRIFVEIIAITDIKEQDERRKHANLFFGFNNPMLTSIVGGEEVWAWEHVPHIPKLKEDGTRYDKYYLDVPPLYIRHYDTLLLIKFVTCEELGEFIEVTRAKYINKNKKHYIFVDDKEEELKHNEFKSLARGTHIFNVIAKFVTLGKIYFQNNEIGSIFYKYLEEC